MYQRNRTLVCMISYHDSKRKILLSRCQWNAKVRKSAKFENKNKMAVVCDAAVLSLIEELADNLVVQEASCCEDDEVLFFHR